MKERRFTRFWLIITLSFLVVIVILILWNISLNATEKATLDQYIQQQLELVTEAASDIEGYFKTIADELRALGRLPEVQYFDEIPTRQALFNSYNRLESLEVTTVGVFDESGISRYTVMADELEGVDLSWRRYFQEAKAMTTDETYAFQFIELQIADPGQISVIVAIPIFQTTAYENQPTPSGAFAGVVVAAFRETTLYQNFVAPVKPAGNGHVFLADRDNFVLWSSDGESIGKNLQEEDLTAFKQIVVHKQSWFSSPAEASFYESPASGDEDRRDDSIRLNAYAPIELGKEFWVIGVWTPKNNARELLQPVYQSQRFVIGFTILTIVAGGILGAFELRREINQRMKVEDALQKSEMDKAISEERNRLARNLHDSVTQSIYSLTLLAEAGQRMIKDGDIQQAESNHFRLREIAQQALQEMRLLVYELRPPQVLHSGGLIGALEQRLEAVERRAGIDARLDVDVEFEIPAEIEVELLHISQEALNNALKHSKASEVVLSLRAYEDNLRLEVEDNGQGFDRELARSKGGMGLTNMGERVEKIGGKLTIQSEIDSGTTIRVIAPIVTPIDSQTGFQPSSDHQEVS
jgi:signal transduction histidine kinase